MPTVTTFDALLSGFSWNGLGGSARPVFLSYSFETAPAASYATLFDPEFLASFKTFGAAEQATAREALKAWADVSGITLFEVPAGQGDIRFGLYDFEAGGGDFAQFLGVRLYALRHRLP